MNCAHPRIVPRVDLDLNRHHIVSYKLKPMLLKANLSGRIQPQQKIALVYNLLMI